jgi:hypothetical protein
VLAKEDQDCPDRDRFHRIDPVDVMGVYLKDGLPLKVSGELLQADEKHEEGEWENAGKGFFFHAFS